MTDLLHRFDRSKRWRSQDDEDHVWFLSSVSASVGQISLERRPVYRKTSDTYFLSLLFSCVSRCGIYRILTSSIMRIKSYARWRADGFLRIPLVTLNPLLPWYLTSISPLHDTNICLAQRLREIKRKTDLLFFSLCFSSTHSSEIIILCTYAALHTSKGRLAFEHVICLAQKSILFAYELD